MDSNAYQCYSMPRYNTLPPSSLFVFQQTATHTLGIRSTSGSFALPQAKSRHTAKWQLSALVLLLVCHCDGATEAMGPNEGGRRLEGYTDPEHTRGGWRTRPINSTRHPTFGRGKMAVYYSITPSSQLFTGLYDEMCHFWAMWCVCKKKSSNIAFYWIVLQLLLWKMREHYIRSMHFHHLRFRPQFCADFLPSHKLAHSKRVCLRSQPDDSVLSQVSGDKKPRRAGTF